jgi:hypothetical protein
LRVKEAEEKAAQKKLEKIQKSLEKTNMKGKKIEYPFEARR